MKFEAIITHLIGKFREHSQISPHFGQMTRRVVSLRLLDLPLQNLESG